LDKIRVALVGLGNMGRNHFRVLNAMPQFDLVAVMDPYAETLPAETEKEISLVRSMAELEMIDFAAAIVASPTETHFQVVKKLLEWDRHVLVEKPAASTYEQSIELKDLAAHRSLRLCVGNIERSNPAVAALSRVLDFGVIGTPVHFSATRAGGFPKSVKPGNHVILDLAVHELDVARKLLGPLQIKHSVCHSTSLHEICDTAEVLLSNEDGITASIHVNWLTPSKIRSLRVTGDLGVCEVDYIAQSCVVSGHDVSGRIPQSWGLEVSDDNGFCEKVQIPIERQEPLRVQLERFYRWLSGEDATDLCFGDAMVESVRLVEECVNKATSGFDVEAFESLKKGRSVDQPSL